MSAVYEIPLQPRPQRFALEIGGATYLLETMFREADNAGWILNIRDRDGAALAFAIPLVTGADLLDGLEYLGIPAVLFIATEGAPTVVPDAQTLGVTSHLMLEA